MDNLAVYLLIFTLNFIWISALITYFTSKYFEYKLKNSAINNINNAVSPISYSLMLLVIEGLRRQRN